VGVAAVVGWASLSEGSTAVIVHGGGLEDGDRPPHKQNKRKTEAERYSELGQMTRSTEQLNQAAERLFRKVLPTPSSTSTAAALHGCT